MNGAEYKVSWYSTNSSCAVGTTSRHFVYSAGYITIEQTKAPDGEELDSTVYKIHITKVNGKLTPVLVTSRVEYVIDTETGISDTAQSCDTTGRISDQSCDTSDSAVTADNAA
ncbi:MAG: hypothetical protein ACOYJJ_04270 [Anaerovoracaceae bacterium]|jgi:hypothetical protein